MAVGIEISAANFSAYLRCATKAYLMMTGQSAPSTYFSDLEASIARLYRERLPPHTFGRSGADVLVDFSNIGSANYSSMQSCRVSTDTMSYVTQPTDRRRDLQSGDLGERGCVPVALSPWHRPETFDQLVLGFGALAISQVLRKTPHL